MPRKNGGYFSNLESQNYNLVMTDAGKGLSIKGNRNSINPAFINSKGVYTMPELKLLPLGLLSLHRDIFRKRRSRNDGLISYSKCSFGTSQTDFSAGVSNYRGISSIGYCLRNIS